MTRKPRPVLERIQLATFIAGGILLLYGGIPMLRAMAVTNRLIDEGGIEPGEMEIIGDWQTWGFAPQFTICAASGAILMLLIVISIAGILFGEDAARGSLTAQFRDLLGPAGAQAVEAMLKGASSVTGGGVTAFFGILLLFVAALGVVVQLKDALNTIWDAPEPEGSGFHWYLRTYVISLAGVMALGFLLIVSLVVSTVLAAVTTWAGRAVGNEALLGQAMSTLISLGLLTVLFAMLFKWFSDTEIAWRDVLPGALVTALLFNFGKFAIGWYIGTQGPESTYGAAASIVILLIWVYYSAQIVLFGAELTHAYATEAGSLRVMDVNAELPHKATA